MTITDAELNQLITLHIARGPWDPTRCPVCGWPLYETIDQGCIPRNCSMRPAPSTRADAPVDYAGERWHELYMLLAKAEKDPLIHADARTFSAFVTGITVDGRIRRRRSWLEPSPGRTLCIATLLAYGILKENQL